MRANQRSDLSQTSVGPGLDVAQSSLGSPPDVSQISVRHQSDLSRMSVEFNVSLSCLPWLSNKAVDPLTWQQSVLNSDAPRKPSFTLWNHPRPVQKRTSSSRHDWILRYHGNEASRRRCYHCYFRLCREEKDVVFSRSVRKFV